MLLLLLLPPLLLHLQLLLHRHQPLLDSLCLVLLQPPLLCLCLHLLPLLPLLWL
jgi:hypothetical protein